MTDPTPADRLRALTLLEAADFLRDAHFRDGLSVQEIGTALRHTADEADPMVGSLARDGFGLDEIAAMLGAASAVVPSADRAALREPLRRALAEADGFRYEGLEPHDYQRHVGAVLAVLPAPVDRAAVRAAAFEEAAAHYAKLTDQNEAYNLAEHGSIDETARLYEAVRDVVAGLRRLAGEAQQDEHVCKPGASLYYCPTAGEVESDCHGGFDVCCGRPDLHQSVSEVQQDEAQAEPECGDSAHRHSGPCALYGREAHDRSDHRADSKDHLRLTVPVLRLAAHPPPAAPQSGKDQRDHSRR